LGGCGDAQASCAPNECRDGFCTESCRSDSDCSDKSICSAGSCIPKRANGNACQRDAECTSGYCTDGVCCNSRCHGQCEWCHDKDSVGTCTAAYDNPPPGRPACPAGGGENSCTIYTCDPRERSRCTPVEVECGAYACHNGGCKRSCTRPTSSVDCAPDAVCDAGRCVQTQICKPADCSPYACGPTGACVKRCTSSLECAGGHSCTSRGDCVRRAESAPFGCACQHVTAQSVPAAWWLTAVFALSAFRRRRSRSR
jgi:MYXO-CTERM domain-containing protein